MKSLFHNAEKEIKHLVHLILVAAGWIASKINFLGFQRFQTDIFRYYFEIYVVRDRYNPKLLKPINSDFSFFLFQREASSFIRSLNWKFYLYDELVWWIKLTILFHFMENGGVFFVQQSYVFHYKLFQGARYNHRLFMMPYRMYHSFGKQRIWLSFLPSSV